MRRRRRCTLRPQLRPAQRADGHECPLPLLVKMVDVATLVGFLPDRQARAGSAPCFENFGIGARMRPDPLEKIQDQRLYRVRHDYLRC
jgi:hypothetical protein